MFRRAGECFEVGLDVIVVGQVSLQFEEELIDRLTQLLLLRVEREIHQVP